MNRITTRDILAVAVASTIAATTFAQFRPTQPEATTARFDAQHTGWIPVDRVIAPDKMSGFSLQWKSKVNNTTKNGAALSGGVVAGAGLGITLAHLGASGNRTIAIDMDNGHVFFDRAYAATATTAPSKCRSASLATPTLATPLTPPAAVPIRPDGQAANGPNTQLPYSSVIGEPGEGLPPIKPGAMYAAPGSFFAPPGAKPYDGTPASAAAGVAYVPDSPSGGRSPVNGDGGGFPGAPGGGRGGAPGGRGGAVPVFGQRSGGARYALSNDGALHALTSNDGLDGLQPMPFLPPGSQASDLIMVNGTVYAATMNGCGGRANGIYAIRPVATPAGGTFPKVSFWMTGTANPHTPSFNADGIMFVTVGSGTGKFSDSVVSLDPATLEVKNTFTLAGANFISSPTIFRTDNRDIVAAQAADGRIILLDGANLSAPLYVSIAAGKLSAYEPAGLATWQDSSSQRWILSSTGTSIVAYKVTLNSTSASLGQGWTLSGLKAPLAPLVVNGVVFALSSGDSASTTKGYAELYAVDGVTGKTLWNSGKTITGFVPQSSALWNSLGQILLSTADNTVYAFGMNLDRHL